MNPCCHKTNMLLKWLPDENLLPSTANGISVPRVLTLPCFMKKPTEHVYIYIYIFNYYMILQFKAIKFKQIFSDKKYFKYWHIIILLF